MRKLPEATAAADVLAKYRTPSMEQDIAAGGKSKRKLYTKTGDIATVSLVPFESKNGWRLTLRFKWGGSTVERSVGQVNARSRFEAIQEGWKAVRERRVAEENGWSWVEP